jgi:hypothetical protein
MTLGSASESVTVRGGAPPLDAESSTIGTVVEQRKVNELPLNGRNVFNLNRAILLIVAWFWLGKTRISLVLV